MRIAVRSGLAAGVMILCMLGTAQAEAPARPGKVRSEKIGQTQTLITWEDRADNEDLYIVKRKLYGASRFLTRAVLPKNTTEFVDDVRSDLIYVYRVVARTEGGLTRDSTNCFVNRTPPPPPLTVVARLIALTVVKVTWSDHSFSENGFIIERRQEGMPTYEKVGEVGRNKTKFIDRTLISATSYTYRVVSKGRPSRCIHHSRPSKERAITTKGGVRVLELELGGNGAGWVVSEPEGINCGPDRRRCHAEFRAGEIVRLYATPHPGSYFRYWDDDPHCKDQDGSCVLRMGKPRQLTAIFRKIPDPKDTR